MLITFILSTTIQLAQAKGTAFDRQQMDKAIEQIVADNERQIAKLEKECDSNPDSCSKMHQQITEMRTYNRVIQDPETKDRLYEHMQEVMPGLAKEVHSFEENGNYISRHSLGLQKVGQFGRNSYSCKRDLEKYCGSETGETGLMCISNRNHQDPSSLRNICRQYLRMNFMILERSNDLADSMLPKNSKYYRSPASLTSQ